MGQIKSNLRKRSFWLQLSQEDTEWNLPSHLLDLIHAREENKVHVTKDIYIASQENAERAPPGSGGFFCPPEEPTEICFVTEDKTQ